MIIVGSSTGTCHERWARFNGSKFEDCCLCRPTGVSDLLSFARRKISPLITIATKLDKITLQDVAGFREAAHIGLTVIACSGAEVISLMLLRLSSATICLDTQ